MGKPVKVAYLADTSDLRRSLDQAKEAMLETSSTAQKAGAKIDAGFERAAEGADNVASRGAQAAGALSGLGDLIGGPFGAAMKTAGVATQAAADAGDLLNVVTESSIIKKTKDVAVTVASTAASKAAAVGAKAWAAAQWVLNAAMDANPLGLLAVGLAAVVAGLVLAYKNSATFRSIVQGAFKVAGDAVKWVVDRLGDLLGLLGHVPGMGWAKDAAAKFKGMAEASAGVATSTDQAATSMDQAATAGDTLKSTYGGLGSAASVYAAAVARASSGTKKHKTSIDDVIAEQRKAIRAQNDFAHNMDVVAKRFGAAGSQMVADAGQDGPAVAAALADGPKKKGDLAVRNYKTLGARARDGMRSGVRPDDPFSIGVATHADTGAAARTRSSLASYFATRPVDIAVRAYVSDSQSAHVRSELAALRP